MTTTKKDKKQKDILERLEEAGNLIHEYTRSDLVGTQLQLFLVICNNEGITSLELAEYLDKPQGSLSRNLKKLSLYKNSKGDMRGFDLIQTRPDYDNRRTLAIYLTDKGRKLKAELKKTLEDS